MRLIYMGSPSCAIAPLKHLMASRKQHDYQLVGVVSQAAKIVGRGRQKEPCDPPVAAFAKAEGLTVLQPEKASDPAFLAELSQLKPDVIITCAYGQILNSAFLAIPSRATINIHPSKLPQYRGATPVPAALLAGEERTAVTILFTVRELDAGAIIVQEDFAIRADETAADLMQRLFTASGPLLLKALERLKDPNFMGRPQDPSQISHCRKICKEDGLIDWRQSSQQISQRYRALHPWPGSYSFLADKRVMLESLTLLPKEQEEELNRSLQLTSKEPGSLHFAKGQKLLLAKTGDGWLAITRLKPAGSRSLEAFSFWNGLKVKDQLRFTNYAKPS